MISHSHIHQEINKLKSYIQRWKGVGVYQEHCNKWATYIEAYEALLNDAR
jgi:hypothetical protein